MTAVYCSCEQYLGEVAPSVVGLKQGRLVWHIQPGWRWDDFEPGLLVYDDETHRMERRLAHELGVDYRTEGYAVGREVDLPVSGAEYEALRLRCPKCRTPRRITGREIFRPARR